LAFFHQCRHFVPSINLTISLKQFLFHFKKDPHLTAIGLTFIDTYGKITSGSNELIREVTGLGSMYQLFTKMSTKIHPTPFPKFPLPIL
jgi:hypothetical protein